MPVMVVAAAAAVLQAESGENMVNEEQSKSMVKLGDKQAWSDGDGGENEKSPNDESGDVDKAESKSKSHSDDGKRPKSKSSMKVVVD